MVSSKDAYLLFMATILFACNAVKNENLDAGEPISQAEMEMSEQELAKLKASSKTDKLNKVLTEQTVANTGGNVVQGDMVMPQTVPNVFENAARDTRLHWRDAIVPYVITNSFQRYERLVIASAMKAFHDKSCVRFVPRQSERDFIYIMKGEGCYSSVGRIGGQQNLSLGADCVYRNIVIHELMHAIGFYHEQSRTDRDDYITVHLENVLEHHQSNFDKLDQTIISHLGEEYDTCSIMHYKSTTFSFNGKPVISRKPAALDQNCEIGEQFELSVIDVRKINKIYKCPGCFDQYEKCKFWANSGWCKTSWMTSGCPESCGFCNANRNRKNCILDILDCYDIGYDYYGNDIQRYDGIKDAAECHSLCQKNENCAFWTVSRGQKETSWLCFLKNKMAKFNRIIQQRTRAVISGPKDCARDKFCDCFELFYDYTGYDLYYKTNILSPSECQKLCQEESNCHFWTWTRVADNEPLNWCYLKKAEAIRNRQQIDPTISSAISGPKFCS